MLINVAEVFVVQQLAPGASAEIWQDLREFDEDGPAFDLADYLREDGETVARVVRRWR